MFWLGLVLPICYVASYTGAAIPTQFPVLSIALTAGLWRRGNLGAMLPLFFSTAWAALSLTWAPNLDTAIYGLWVMCIWAMSFWLGTTLLSLEGLWRGLAIGMSISSAVAVAQWLGWSAIPSDGNAGLLYNTTLQGLCIAIVMLGLWVNGLIAYIPALLPGLILANSRGAYVVLAAGVLAQFGKFQAIAIMLSLAVIYVFTFYGPSDVERLQIWLVSGLGISWHGMGVGTFEAVFYHDFAGIKHRPGHAHNDYLQLWFELGIGSLGVYFVLGCAAWRRSRCRAVIVALLVCSTFYFPLYAPIPGFVAFLLAGHSLRYFRWDGFGRDIRGRFAALRGRPPQPADGRVGHAGFPVQSSVSEV